MNLLSSCKNSQTLNGTCTLLQVQRVSTVILHTEMRRENVIENSKNAIQMQVQAWGLKKEATRQTQSENLELWTLKMC